ncbi:MAG: helicase [Streptomyces sp.]|nr:helicase [Streptomyces sp.]
MTSYADFLVAKQARAPRAGRPCDPSDVNPFLHPWQREIVAWAVQTGRAALWEDTGLGKTVQALEWCRLSANTSLIVAPLAVCHQTAREASRIGLTAAYARSDEDVTGPGIWITNYERAESFDPNRFGAVVLDEASILKNADGKTRAMLTEHFAPVPYRLACTATPAPNEPEELTGQAAFLGHSTRANMLAAYFVHDDTGWRMKGHARKPMFSWLSTWAVAIRRPSDMGYDDGDYVLPGVNVTPHLLDIDVVPDGQLFATDLGGVGGRAAVRRETLAERCKATTELVAAEPDEPWILWCGLNDEADTLANLIPGSVNVHGAMTPEDKAAAFLGFADGSIRVLITKPKIASFGMNWQHCARMAFVGLSDSMETYYQAIRRCHRYGQRRVVDVHVVVSRLESAIAANVGRKQTEADRLIDDLVREMRPDRWRAAA